jgi:3,4-dihydroxy 2-butanone 4-phosphate synthase/GTP cyclohydrolase II
MSADFGILIKDLAREPSAQLYTSAAEVTADDVAFLLRHTCGLLSVAMDVDRAAELNLPHLPRDAQRPRWTTTVDARTGISTGVSSGDRARTARLLASGETKASDLVTPGHMFVTIQPKLEAVSWADPASRLCRLPPWPETGGLALFGRLLTNSGMVMSTMEAEEFGETLGLRVTRTSDVLLSAIDPRSGFVAPLRVVDIVSKYKQNLA